MNGAFWTVNSLERLGNFIAHLESLWDSEKYLRIQIKTGKARTMSQNNLFQMWARDYAKHLLRREATEAEHEEMKETLQRHCYAETHRGYLLREKKDLFTGEVKKDRAFTHLMDTGEMYEFMEWIQNKAAQDGLILEAIGEFAELRQEAA